MSVKFVTPPGWPSVVEGYIPPASWVPEPSWPAPPEGWAFYVDEAEAPTMPPLGAWQPPSPTAAAPASAAKGKSRTPLIVGAAVVVLALIGAGVFGYFQLFGAKTMTTQQFAEMVATKEIGGVVLTDSYKDSSPEIATQEREAKLPDCAALMTHVRQHLLRGYGGQPAEGTSTFAELFDSIDAAKQMAALEKACNLAEGACYWKPVKSSSQDGADVVLEHGLTDTGDQAQDQMCLEGLGTRVTVRVDNVLFSKQQRGDVEPSAPGFVSATIAQVRSVTGR